jgi:hypothetical protein
MFWMLNSAAALNDAQSASQGGYLFLCCGYFKHRHHLFYLHGSPYTLANTLQRLWIVI